MTITENKLRQIVRQEIKLVFESRQPTEDLAELYLKLDKLLSFHFGGEQEEQTLSFLNNEMIPTLNVLISIINNVDLNRLNEVFKFLNYLKREPKRKTNFFDKTKLQLAVQNVNNKLEELENTIFDKRVNKDKEYEKFHNSVILPQIKMLSDKISELISSNTRFPQPNPQRTKRDLLKRLKRRY
jgi:hypothetical protein